MKKFLIILLFLISTNVVFSAEYPRWVAQPIYVYVPEYGNFTQLMKKAFSTWQNQSKNLVRLSFVNSPSRAQIHVEFVDFFDKLFWAWSCCWLHTTCDKREELLQICCDYWYKRVCKSL